MGINTTVTYRNTQLCNNHTQNYWQEFFRWNRNTVRFQEDTGVFAYPFNQSMKVSNKNSQNIFEIEITLKEQARIY